MEILLETWPWYISGFFIAVTMFILLWLGGEFGVSSNFRTICSIAGAGKKVAFFNFDWKKTIWNLVFLFGSLVGGFIAHNYLLETNYSIALSEKTINKLSEFNIYVGKNTVPTEIFDIKNLLSLKGIVFMIAGGFLIGFGSRWAGGCTSGHAISGLSNFQLPSLIAVIGFFIGGIISTFFIIPLFF